MKTRTDEIVKALRDLHKQATEERSHYYVGKVVTLAADRIEHLEAQNAKLVEALYFIYGSTTPDASALRSMARKAIAAAEKGE